MSRVKVWRMLPVVTTSAAFFFACCFSGSSAQPVTPQETPAQVAASASSQMSLEQAAAESAEPAEEARGDVLVARKRYQAAIEAYKKAPRDSASVWNKMGIAYQLMMDENDAEACYRKSLKLDRKDANVLNNLGTVYNAEKRYGDAEKMYRAALKINPKSAVIRKNLGTTLLALHKYKKGWAEYQTALTIDPHIFDGTTGPTVMDPASLQDRGAMNYYMARGCAQAGMTECAINYLRMAMIEGYTNPKKLAADSEFARLRELPAFQELMQSQKNP
ncbi:MAG: tetratricopeptide repeat protein [Terracidiphilus sp.]